MDIARLPYPDLPALTRCLEAVLPRSPAGPGPITVLRRDENIFASSYASEIVTCRREDGRNLRLLCKYSVPGGDHSGYGHWRGIAYEAAVYERVLQPLDVASVTYYGTYIDPATTATWLVIEYVEAAWRLGKAPVPDAMLRAADWLGRFHRASEAHPIPNAASFLQVHDADHYRAWVRKVARYARSIRRDLPWLLPFCGRAEGLIAPFAASSRVVIHGEYYPHNILYRDGSVYPIDWESAALSVGEIDLACQIQGWALDVADACSAIYREARWPAGAPANFASQLATARLLSAFHWLGEEASPNSEESTVEYIAQLREAGEALDLL